MNNWQSISHVFSPEMMEYGYVNEFYSIYLLLRQQNGSVPKVCVKQLHIGNFSQGFPLGKTFFKKANCCREEKKNYIRAQFSTFFFLQIHEFTDVKA